MKEKFLTLIGAWAFFIPLALVEARDRETAQTPIVSDVDELRTYEFFHILRTAVIAVAIKYHYADLFPEIDADEVWNFTVRNHDRAKIDLDDQFLCRHGLEQMSPSIPEMLFRIWGRRVAQLEEPLQHQAKETIKRMNDVEAVEERLYAEIKGLSDKQLFQLRRIVRIADIMDRANSDYSREEFGNSVTPEEAWLDGTDLLIAQSLRNRYQEIVNGLNVSTIRRSHSQMIKFVPHPGLLINFRLCRQIISAQNPYLNRLVVLK